MPGGGLPVIDETMHDAQHQIQAHLQATARALNTGNANAKPQTAAAPIDHQPVPSAEQLVEHAEKNRWCGIGTGGCVREFPYAITVADGAAADSNTDGAAAQAVTSALPIVSETLDIGHRHFSGMHWVYPNTFTPFKESPALYRAAVNTMAAKSDNGGGHTGWSAVWEASLWARLRRPEQAFGALNKFVTKFLSPNLQSMHPPLVGKSEVDCGTCFGENYQLNVARALRKERNIKEIVHRRQLVQHRSQPDSPESHDNDKEGTGGTQDAASAETVPLMSQEDLQHMEDVTLLPRGMITSDQSKVSYMLLRLLYYCKITCSI